MTDITLSLNSVQDRIHQAAAASGRNPAEIVLLAVSKTRSMREIRLAHSNGLTKFGENYLQEGLQKITGLRDTNIEWHFIGPVQANKTRDLAAHFDWVQSVDRLKIAQRLNEQRSSSAPPLNICVQVNIDHEPQKAGVTPDDASTLCQAISALPRLKLRGLMVIPAASTDPKQQYASFSAARTLFDELVAEGLPLDTLSMGMSGDLEPAIRAGTTMLRIGTDIFGLRK